MILLIHTNPSNMKQLLLFTLTLLFGLTGNAQSPADIESTLKYPDELVFDKSWMNYTIYKPNTSIACKYPMKQVSKTQQRTVFVNKDSSLKMSFAFFDLKKLPFYVESDSHNQAAYKFFASDSVARSKAYTADIKIVEADTSRGILYYSENVAQKTKFYLVGTDGNTFSIIMVAGKELDIEKLKGDMHMSYKLNLKD